MLPSIRTAKKPLSENALNSGLRRLGYAQEEVTAHGFRATASTILNERGLTLAEILVAVAIIGLGLVGLAVVIPVSSYGLQEGNQLSTATFLAEQMIERARSAQWTQNPAVDCLGIGTAAAPVPTEIVDSTNTVVSATCNGVLAENVKRGIPRYGRDQSCDGQSDP